MKISPQIAALLVASSAAAWLGVARSAPDQTAPKPVALLASTAQKPPVVGGELALYDVQERKTFSTLRHTDVRAQISGGIAQVVVEQQFSNPSKVPVEAVYTFPLPAQAAVNAMEFTVGELENGY